MSARVHAVRFIPLLALLGVLCSRPGGAYAETVAPAVPGAPAVMLTLEQAQDYAQRLQQEMQDTQAKYAAAARTLQSMQDQLSPKAAPPPETPKKSR